MSSVPGILTIDIETSPIEAYVWGLWDQNVGVDFIKTEWTILSYAAKWLGEKKVYYGDTSGRGAHKVRKDKALVREIRDLLDDADIVVAQNGKKFDVRKINARLIEHGYPPPRPFRVVDTLIAAKRCFAFTSQKLAWTSLHLTDAPKDDHRKFPGIELWKECLADNPKAWAEMKKYNKQDVVSTEKVYLKLRPWIDNHPNIGAYEPSETPVCPKCGSDRLQYQGTRVMQQGRYQRYQCQNCGGWSRAKEMLIPLALRRKQLVPL
jgi:RNase_H superfamily